jgi:hypothetical protein
MSIRAEDAQKAQEEIDHDATQSAYSCELEYHMAFQIQEMLRAQAEAVNTSDDVK